MAWIEEQRLPELRAACTQINGGCRRSKLNGPVHGVTLVLRSARMDTCLSANGTPASIFEARQSVLQQKQAELPVVFQSFKW